MGTFSTGLLETNKRTIPVLFGAVRKRRFETGQNRTGKPDKTGQVTKKGHKWKLLLIRVETCFPAFWLLGLSGNRKHFADRLVCWFAGCQFLLTGNFILRCESEIILENTTIDRFTRWVRSVSDGFTALKMAVAADGGLLALGSLPPEEIRELSRRVSFTAGSLYHYADILNDLVNDMDGLP